MLHSIRLGFYFLEIQVKCLVSMFCSMLNSSKKRRQRRDRMCLQDFIFWVISHINPLTAAINITGTLCCIFMQYILYILKSQWYTGINIHFCTVGKNQGWKTKATLIFLSQSATDDLMLWWSVYEASTHSFIPPPGMIGFWWKFQMVTWWICPRSRSCLPFSVNFSSH